jgi:parallel beta-helix repeat protein
MKKIVLLAFLSVLLSTAVVVGFIRPVVTQGTIYIRDNGSVDPPTANISSVDNITYTFTGNNYDEIVVERDNIVVDGAGYALRGIGAPESRGIFLSGKSNVTIKNMKIKSFVYGIWLNRSSNNSIYGNNITNNIGGILLTYSSNNSIFGNNITNQYYGIALPDSSNNIIYHNNFVDNTEQVYSYNSTNVWDDGYPSGGNYWSHYTNVDQYRGPYQNVTGSDGIWDYPYVIDENNQDNYPIVPEFPTWASMLFILIVLTVVIVIYRRRLKKHHSTKNSENLSGSPIFVNLVSSLGGDALVPRRFLRL